MKKVLLTIGIAAIFVSCNSTKTEETSNDTTVDTENSTEKAVDEVSTMETATTKEVNEIAQVIDSYLEIKDALVNDDQEGAATAGSSLANSLSVLNLDQYADDDLTALKEIIEVAKNHGEHISESDISHQREHFEALGADIKDLIGITGTDRTLYHQYCPMYNGNKGGMWLSASEEVLNPLFGSQMLRCGRVEDTITL